MNGKKYLKISISGIVIVGFLFSMIACQHSVFTYNGRMVKPANRIPLKEGGPHKSEWKEEDLTLNYNYQKQGDTLEISGEVTFTNHIVYNFRDFNDFFLTVYFTDVGGKINGEQTLTSAGVGQQIEKMSFNRRLTLPPGSEGMVFGYRGHAVDRSSGSGSFGIDGSVDWEFWKTPTR